MIESESGTAAGHEADLTDEDQCAATVKAAVAQFGRLDILDNNVGIASLSAVTEETQSQWERVMRVNVEAMFLNAKHAIPAMIESGDGGAIVNISSIAALRPRGMSAYSTSKAAVIGLTRAMAIDHAGTGFALTASRRAWSTHRWCTRTACQRRRANNDGSIRSSALRVPAGTSGVRWYFLR